MLALLHQFSQPCSLRSLSCTPAPPLHCIPLPCRSPTCRTWPSRAGPPGRPHYCLRRPAPPVARTPPAAGPASPFRTRPSRSGPRLASPSGPLPGPLRRRPPRSRFGPRWLHLLPARSGTLRDGPRPQTRPSPPGLWFRLRNCGGPVQGIGGEDTAVGRTSGQARKCVLRRGPTPHSLRSSMPSRWDRL